MQPKHPALPPPRRDIVVGLMSLQVLCSVLGLIYTIVEYGFSYESMFVVIVTILLITSLTLYLRRYDWGRYISLIGLTIAFAFFLPVEAINTDFPLSIFIPPIYALLIAEAPWILFSAATITSVLTARAMDAGLMLDPIDLIIALLVVGGMSLARKITDDAMRKQAHQTLLLERERSTLEARVAERTQDLQEANAALVQANRLKDAFLANISHELRSPLNVLLGTVELLKDGAYGPTTERQQEALDNAADSGRQLLNHIGSLLDLALLESGQLQLDREPIPVLDLCENCLNTIQAQAEARSMHLDFHIDSTICVVFGDARYLRKALLALLDNALKFTPDGGRIGLEARLSDAQLELIVSDTGIGIASEQQEHLFAPFVQLDQRLSRTYEGVGIGLSLAARIVSLHGGTMKVASELGRGSRFYIRLPQ